MRLALYLYSILVLTRGAAERRYIALCIYSALVLTRGAWEQGKPRFALRNSAHKGSLGTRLAQGLYSVLVINRGTWERG